MVVPIVLDTDVGVDVDDMWAIAFMLGCPELDVRLVVSENGDTDHGARLAAKLLDLAGRADIPIGVGVPLNHTPKPHAAWLGTYELGDYPGSVVQDGVGAMIDTIRSSPEPVTVVAIGPLVNVAEALRRAPDIIDNSRFVGMHGALRRGYLGSPEPGPEYNVFAQAAAAQQVFRSGWDITITPLDTCGEIVLEGDRFTRVGDCGDPLIRAVIDNHELWCTTVKWVAKLGIDPSLRSSVLYDTVAIYLAFSEDLLTIEELPVRVADDGLMTIADVDSPDAHILRCATEWRDIGTFYDLLTDRLVRRG